MAWADEPYIHTPTGGMDNTPTGGMDNTPTGGKSLWAKCICCRLKATYGCKQTQSITGMSGTE